MTLEGLGRKAKNCERCRLSKSRKNVVVGDGDAGAKIMIFGEAPGREEDQSGHVFVGAAGRILDEMFASIGLTRENLYITNIVKCRPPRNREPFTDEIGACDYWLRQQLNIIDPKIIVLLGRIALKKFFPKAEIGAIHGEHENFQNRLFFFSYHPATALHNAKLYDVLMKDVKNLEKILEQR